LGPDGSPRPTVSFDMGERDAVLRPLPYLHPSLYPAFLSFIALSDSQHHLNSPPEIWARIARAFSVCCATAHNDTRNPDSEEMLEDGVFDSSGGPSPLGSPLPPSDTNSPAMMAMTASSSSSLGIGVQHQHYGGPPPTPPPQLLSSSMPFEYANSADPIEDEFFEAAMRTFSPRRGVPGYREPKALLLRHRGRPSIHSCGFIGTLCECCECPQCGNTRYSMPIHRFVSCVDGMSDTLVSLHLGSNIATEDTDALQSLLPALDALRSLSIEGNSLAERLLPTVPELTSLDTLSVRSTTGRLDLPPRNEAADHGYKCQSCISTLHMYRVAYPYQLFEYIGSECLTTLNVFFAARDNKRKMMLAAAASLQDGTLRSLSVAGDVVWSDEAVDAVHAALASEDCAVRHLRLSGLRDGGERFAHSVLCGPRLPHLTTLDLSNSGILNRDVAKFCVGTDTRFPALRVLVLAGNEIGDVGAHELDDRLPASVVAIALGGNTNIRGPKDTGYSSRVTFVPPFNLERRWPL
jgi:hypothetical protein